MESTNSPKISEDFLKYFPKEEFYPNQLEAMQRIHSALIERKVVLFEGACGTGKTLSSLAPALDVGKKLNKLVVIATNVHQQMLQFIEEAREIRAAVPVKVIVLKGKLHMCPENKGYDECDVLRENTYEAVQLQNDIERNNAQIGRLEREYRETSDESKLGLRDGLSAETEMMQRKLSQTERRECKSLRAVLSADEKFMSEFRRWLFADVRTAEEVSAKAEEHGMCGYELLKREMRSADLLICNYHHVLNFEILQFILNWADKSIEDVILIFDEAHNVESSARSHASRTISEKVIEGALNELESMRSEMPNAIDVDDVRRFVEALRNALHDAYISHLEFGELERVGSDWHDIIIRDPKDTEDMVSKSLYGQIDSSEAREFLKKTYIIGTKIEAIFRDRFKKGETETRRTSSTLAVANFMLEFIKFAGTKAYYPVINVRREPGGDITARLELFMCIPKNVTYPLIESVHSAVLMSATLQPFDVMRSTLGITRGATEFSYGPSFPENRRLTLTVPTPPLFAKNREDSDIIRITCNVLGEIVDKSHGNVLIIFPSNAEAARYHEIFFKSDEYRGIKIFLDEAGKRAEEIRDQFFQIGEEGGKSVMFTYLWGTLSEGLDYRDGRARVVAVVGVGYPALNERMRAIQVAYDHEFNGNGWEYAIEIPTIRKVRQALGRIVRSPTDYGVRILVDARYTGPAEQILGKYSVAGLFPYEERHEFIDVEPERIGYSLMNFFNDTERADESM